MQKKIAIVNDISGFGRCSVTVALPILSAMRIQCGILPTAILSNHTEYPDYSMLDFTPYMSEYLDKWNQLHLSFDGIYTGFLGSKEQLSIIRDMLDHFSFSQIVVDPVMGDHGMIYDSYTREMCESMQKLVCHATLTTPNLTELCLLTNRKYHEHIHAAEIEKMCQTLAKNGPAQIIVTGVEKEDMIGNAIYENGSFDILYEKKVLPLRPGTGDVFASIVAGLSLHNIPLKEAVQTAARFIVTCLESAEKQNIPINDGVCFEEHLNILVQKTALVT
ncbi:MAG: pyridoxamine kinase [Clostridium sp.]|nr:pyridoxamine kinase [Clostridium sp.]